MIAERAKKIIKKSFLKKPVLFLYDFYCFPKMLFLLRQLRRTDRAILLLGTSTYNNLGDHLIALKELEFLKKCFNGHIIIEIPTQIFKRYTNKIVKNVPQAFTIIISGGGWMGNLWPDDEYVMQLMLLSFSKNNVIIFPQTIYYDTQMVNADKILADANRVYRNCSDITLMLREFNSYQFAIKYLDIQSDAVKMVPDIALFGLKNKRNSEKNLIGLCLRKDREKYFDSNITETVRSFSQANKMQICSFDTIRSHSVPVWMRRKILNQLFRKVSRFEIVVTDRLHGMLIAVLCGCKCLVFDNKTHKVSGVYNAWLKENNRVALLNNSCSEEDIINALTKLKDTDDSQEKLIHNMNKEFYKLEKFMVER